MEIGLLTTALQNESFSKNSLRIKQKRQMSIDLGSFLLASAKYISIHPLSLCLSSSAWPFGAKTVKFHDVATATTWHHLTGDAVCGRLFRRRRPAGMRRTNSLPVYILRDKFSWRLCHRRASAVLEGDTNALSIVLIPPPVFKSLTRNDSLPTSWALSQTTCNRAIRMAIGLQLNGNVPLLYCRLNETR